MNMTADFGEIEQKNRPKDVLNELHINVIFLA